ncbi:MAG TPA: hypothetical protein VHM70_28005 [Polyangiaceae bacterium]|nr:hypothetical protein [Polyangiaceae bacterium]
MADNTGGEESSDPQPSGPAPDPTVTGTPSATGSSGSIAPSGEAMPDTGVGGGGNSPDSNGNGGLGSDEPSSSSPAVPTVPTEPVMEPVPGCHATEEGDATYCKNAYDCADGSSSSASCSQQAGQAAQCTCSADSAHGFFSLNFNLDEFNGTQTCRELAGLCAQDEQPVYAEERDCTKAPLSTDTGTCTYGEDCTRKATLANGMEASLPGSRVLTCWDQGNGQLECDCSEYFEVATFRTVYLGDTDISLACDIAYDICWNGAEPQTSGEPECSLDSTYADPTSCSAATVCSQTATVGDQTISIGDGTNVDCAATDGDAWDCTCYTASENAHVDLPPQSESSATCSDAAAKCADVLATPVTSELECQVMMDAIERDGCESFISCEQTGALGDLVVRRTGGLNVQCSPVDAGWRCACMSVTTGEELKGAPAEGKDGLDACHDFADYCIANIDLALGRQ